MARRVFVERMGVSTDNRHVDDTVDLAHGWAMRRICPETGRDHLIDAAALMPTLDVRLDTQPLIRCADCLLPLVLVRIIEPGISLETAPISIVTMSQFVIKEEP